MHIFISIRTPIISSVIRQKGESQNGCFKKKKHAKFMHTYLYVSGGKKCSFSKKFGVLSLLETPVFRFYRRSDPGP